MRDTTFPRMLTIRQSLASDPLTDPGDALADRLERAGARELLPRGSRVAVAVGSRNIDRLAEMVSRLVSELGAAGCRPFIVPAMGSHGGATAEGQEKLLAGLGITESTVGAPVVPSMETVLLGATDGGAEAFVAQAALEADAIVVVNRVAPHTGYSGPVQSGLQKMMAVGLGKVEGARALHRHGFEASHLIGEVAALVKEKACIAMGVALVEDGRKRLSRLEVLGANDIGEREPGLLRDAESMQPRIPAAQADILVVDEMGKDVSGIGMDPLVTGRGKGLAPGQRPRFSTKRLVVLGLTHGSLGNATGIGLADITTRRLVDAVDWDVTRRNVLTSGALERARIPLVADTDRRAVEMALESLGEIATEDARVVRVRNTRELEEMQVSTALEQEVRQRGDIEIIRGAGEMKFGPDGGIK